MIRLIKISCLAAGARHLTDDEKLYLRLLELVEFVFLFREEICTNSVK
jgi:hypothetical protein